MAWAIRKRGPGKPVAYRAVNPDWTLEPGEELVTEDPAGKMLDADGVTLRPPTEADELPEYKAERIGANRREAQRRIAQALGMPPDTPFDRLVVKEANLLMQAVDAVASGDTAAIANMRSIKARIDAIRSAENAAAAAIEAAASKAEVDAVVVSWPN